MNTVVVHLDNTGNITSIQRAKEPQYIRGNFPSWLRERVALLRMLEGKGGSVHLKGYKVNPNYLFLDVTKKELTEVGKLLGT